MKQPTEGYQVHILAVTFGTDTEWGQQNGGFVPTDGLPFPFCTKPLQTRHALTWLCLAAQIVHESVKQIEGLRSTVFCHSLSVRSLMTAAFPCGVFTARMHSCMTVMVAVPKQTLQCTETDHLS